MITALLLALSGAGAAQEAPAARGRTWDDFPVFVWRQRHRGAPLPEDLVLPFGGTNVERDDEAAWARERGLAFYVGHAPGRDDLHLDPDAPGIREQVESWTRTRDPRLMVRVPCLSEPATRARLRDALARSLAARGGDAGLGISLGDEVSLAPWGVPLELCRGPACEEAWRAWCAARGLSTSAPTTDSTRLALDDGDFSPVGGWLARRRFEQDLTQDVLAELAAEARRLAPGVPVGILGVGGEAALGDLDVERLAARLDFVEVYPRGAARELLVTLRGASALPRSVATVFADQGTPEQAALAVYEHWLRGGDGLVLWDDAALEAAPELCARLARAVAGVRALRRQLPGFPPPPEDVALVHDADAVRLSFLRDILVDGPTWPHRLARYHELHGTRERLVRGWLTAFEAAGRLPGALPLSRVGADTPARFRLLVLPRQLALGADDVARLEAFLDAGGTLVVDEDLGWVDRAGKPRDEEARAALRAELGRHGRVLPAPGWVADVGDGTTGARAAAADAALGLLRTAGVRERPFALARPAGAGWLLAARREPDGSWTCAALPSPRRDALPDAAPKIEPAAGWCVRWLSDPEKRAPADPLVLRVERTPSATDPGE